MLELCRCPNIYGPDCILTICTHEHYPISSSRLQTQIYKPLFPAFFSRFLDFSPYIPLYTDLSIHKQRKTQAFWASATDSYGEKSLPALQLHFAPQRWRHVQTTYKIKTNKLSNKMGKFFFYKFLKKFISFLFFFIYFSFCSISENSYKWIQRRINCC